MRLINPSASKIKLLTRLTTIRPFSHSSALLHVVRDHVLREQDGGPAGQAAPHRRPPATRRQGHRRPQG